MKRVILLILVALLVFGTPAETWALGAGSNAAAGRINFNGVWAYSGVEEWLAGVVNPFAGPAAYKTVYVTETLTVTPYLEMEGFTYRVVRNLVTDDGEEVKREDHLYLGLSTGPSAGGALDVLALIPFDGTNRPGAMDFMYQGLFEATDNDTLCFREYDRNYTRQSEGPSIKKDLKISGVILGPDGKGLPRMQMAIDLFNDFSAMPEQWEEGQPDHHQTLTADLSGVFSADVPVPAGIQTKMGVVITLTLRCALPKGDAYFLADYQDPNAKDAIHISTLVVVDPTEAEFHEVVQDLGEFPVARLIQFANIPQGYLTQDHKGAAEPLQTNLGDLNKFFGYGYVYRLLWDALIVGGVLLDELPALMRSSTSEPLRVDCNYESGSPGTRSHYSALYNTIRLTADRCLYDDASRYTVLHEFGHYFDAATNANGWKHRCDWASKIIDGSNRNHGGYLNTDTGDSFIEGFATWYACVCQLYRKDAKPYMLFGKDLFEPSEHRSWIRNGTQEEYSIASVLVRSMYYFSSVHDFRKLVLKLACANFSEYYDRLVRMADEGVNARQRIESFAIDAALFRMPAGNRRYDPGEPFTDTNRNGTWDTGEPYGDLMYPYDPDKFPFIDASAYPPVFKTSNKHVGESAAFNYPNRHTFALEDNCFIALNGERVDALKVAVRLQDGSSYAYVMAPSDKGIYVDLPSQSHQGKVEISVPGGGTIYRGDLRTLQQQMDETWGQSVPLGSATIAPSDLAPAGTIAAPTGGDVDGSGVFEPSKMSNRDAAILAEGYDPAADMVLDASATESIFGTAQEDETASIALKDLLPGLWLSERMESGEQLLLDVASDTSLNYAFGFYLGKGSGSVESLLDPSWRCLDLHVCEYSLAGNILSLDSERDYQTTLVLTAADDDTIHVVDAWGASYILHRATQKQADSWRSWGWHDDYAYDDHTETNSAGPGGDALEVILPGLWLSEPLGDGWQMIMYILPDYWAEVYFGFYWGDGDGTASLADSSWMFDEIMLYNYFVTSDEITFYAGYDSSSTFWFSMPDRDTIELVTAKGHIHCLHRATLKQENDWLRWMDQRAGN